MLKGDTGDEHIDLMIEMVSELIKKGFAYENNKHVYFEVKKFNDYGQLSNKKLEDLIAFNSSPFRIKSFCHLISGFINLLIILSINVFYLNWQIHQLIYAFP